MLARLVVAAIFLIAAFYWLRSIDPEFGLFIAIALVAFMCWALYLPVRLIVTGNAITITDRGLVDCTSGLGFIAWEEIRGVKLRPYFGLDLIELVVVDDGAILARLSFLRRALWRYYLRSYGGAFNLKAGFIKGGANQLLQILRAHVPSVSNASAL